MKPSLPLPGPRVPRPPIEATRRCPVHDLVVGFYGDPDGEGFVVVACYACRVEARVALARVAPTERLRVVA